MANTKNHALLSDDTVFTLVVDLCYTLGETSSAQEAADLLLNLLTPQEMRMLAIRLHIGKLLVRGASYDEIRQKLFVSSATISRVRLGREHSSNRPRSDSASSNYKVEDYTNQTYSDFTHPPRGKYAAMSLWPVEVLSQILRAVSQSNSKD